MYIYVIFLMKKHLLSIKEVDEQILYLLRDCTFESLCRRFHNKSYDISGHFIWHRTQTDGTVKEIKLKRTDTPSSVHMHLHTVERISWKKATVWNMLSS